MELKVHGIGRLGKDPELLSLPTGTALAKVSLAFSKSYKKSTTGEKVEKTCWITLNAYGATAEFLAKYFQKGDLIYVEGSLEQDNWEDSEGRKKTTYKISAREINFVCPKKRDLKEDVRLDDDEESIPF